VSRIYGTAKVSDSCTACNDASDFANGRSIFAVVGGVARNGICEERFAQSRKGPQRSAKTARRKAAKVRKGPQRRKDGKVRKAASNHFPRAKRCDVLNSEAQLRENVVRVLA